MDEGFFGFLIGIALGLVVVFICSITIINHNWEHDALQHKAAHYDGTTGEFVCNEIKP